MIATYLHEIFLATLNLFDFKVIDRKQVLFAIADFQWVKILHTLQYTIHIHSFAF